MVEEIYYCRVFGLLKRQAVCQRDERGEKLRFRSAAVASEAKSLDLCKWQKGILSFKGATSGT